MTSGWLAGSISAENKIKFCDDSSTRYQFKTQPSYVHAAKYVAALVVTSLTVRVHRPHEVAV